eukprot:sb/3474079/
MNYQNSDTDPGGWSAAKDRVPSSCQYMKLPTTTTVTSSIFFDPIFILSQRLLQFELQVQVLSITVWRRHTPFDSQTVRSDRVGGTRQDVGSLHTAALLRFSLSRGSHPYIPLSTLALRTWPLYLQGSLAAVVSSEPSLSLGV